MDKIQETPKETEKKAEAEISDNTAGSKKIKTREGSGYLRQLYSTARSTAGTNSSNFKNLTTFLVNFIPVDKVDPSELQVRVHFDDSEVQGLAHSIKEHGVLQPILVVQNGDRYKVIAGERRLRASKLAGLERIPARVITSDDKGVHEIALRENLDRVDLHPLEEGEGYLSLLETKAYTSYEAIAQGFGKPKSRIAECIGFTKLPQATKEELMRRGLRQRSVLRRLLATPPSEHMEWILKISPDVDAVFEGENQAAAGAPEVKATEKKASTPKVEKKFEYECSAEKVVVPGFRWKVGEGPERLKHYVDQMFQFLDEATKVVK